MTADTAAMRVLVLGRLFSGLKDGLARRTWEPRGVPAFYRLVEALQEAPDIEVETILANKDADLKFARSFALSDSTAGMIRILGTARPTLGTWRRLDLLVTEFIHMVAALWAVIRFRPDIIYATYALVLPAAVLARFFRQKVVLRLMGIFPHQRAVLTGNMGYFRWALRSPFKAIICTEDGSDPSVILPEMMHKNTPLIVRLNGCDIAKKTDGRLSGADGEIIRILFVGRLEKYKGCDFFIEAAIACLSQAPGRMVFDIIGDGPLKKALQEKVADEKQQGSVRFHGALPHGSVIEHLRSADIYVSVNLHGNLSNANLEAIAAGLCLVIPGSDPATPIDTATDTLLPEDTVLRYDRTAMPQSLSQALLGLIKDPEHIRACKAETIHLADELLKSWREVVRGDIEMLRQIHAEGYSGVLRPPHASAAQFFNTGKTDD